jgi:hypothetical protein
MTLKNRGAVSLLDEVLERRMVLYVLAAGATLAGASVAQAKVISTYRPVSIQYDFHPYNIDLNNDGVADIVLAKGFGECSLCSYDLYTVSANGIGKANGVVGPSRNEPSALTIGTKIGSSDNFISGGWMAYSGYAGGKGNFLNTSNRFLGVRFQINGQTHYGWIGFQRVQGAKQAKLYGWAYETIPNKPIAAGDRGSADSATLRSAEPTSLQLLAMGHTGVADRQRRIAAQAQG